MPSGPSSKALVDHGGAISAKTSGAGVFSFRVHFFPQRRAFSGGPHESTTDAAFFRSVSSFTR